MTNSHTREKLFALVKTQTLLDVTRLETLLHIAEHCLQCADGDFVECGVYRGGSAILIADLLRRSGQNRKIALLDAWQGMPTHSKDDGEVYLQSGSLNDATAESVEKLIQLAAVENHTRLFAGWFHDTLPQLAPPFAFVHIDCDYYEAVLECLDYFLPRMSSFGICVVDDFGTESLRRFPGVRKAVIKALEVQPGWTHGTPYGSRDQAVILYRSNERARHIKNTKIAAHIALTR